MILGVGPADVSPFERVCPARWKRAVPPPHIRQSGESYFSGREPTLNRVSGRSRRVSRPPGDLFLGGRGTFFHSTAPPPARGAGGWVRAAARSRGAAQSYANIEFKPKSFFWNWWVCHEAHQRARTRPHTATFDSHLTPTPSVHAPKRVYWISPSDLADLLSAVWVRRRCRRRQEDRRQEGGAAEQALRPHGLPQQRHRQQRRPEWL